MLIGKDMFGVDRLVIIQAWMNVLYPFVYSPLSTEYDLDKCVCVHTGLPVPPCPSHAIARVNDT